MKFGSHKGSAKIAQALNTYTRQIPLMSTFLRVMTRLRNELLFHHSRVVIIAIPGTITLFLLKLVGNILSNHYLRLMKKFQVQFKDVYSK